MANLKKTVIPKWGLEDLDEIEVDVLKAILDSTKVVLVKAALKREGLDLPNNRLEEILNSLHRAMWEIA